MCLSSDEALVLFDWLARTSKAGEPVPFADPAEQHVLWDLECARERRLPELFSTAYGSLLLEARRRVAAGMTPDDLVPIHLNGIDRDYPGGLERIDGTAWGCRSPSDVLDTATAHPIPRAPVIPRAQPWP